MWGRSSSFLFSSLPSRLSSLLPPPQQTPLLRCSPFSSSFFPYAKKGAQQETTGNPFGRVSNNLKMGLVGMPNVGKSSTFNILTKMEVPASNYPFCTIDPTSAFVAVPDERFDWLCNHFEPAKKTGAMLTVTDIAGLVRGAASGAGLGNNFLSHIRDVDGILHIIRSFPDMSIGHVEGSVDPIRDLEIIFAELMEKDKEGIKDMMKRVGRSRDPEKVREGEIGSKVLGMLERGEDLRGAVWDKSEVEIINRWRLFAVKPNIFLINSEDDEGEDTQKLVKLIQDWAQKRGDGKVIPYSVSKEEEAIFNKELAELEEEEKREAGGGGGEEVGKEEGVEGGRMEEIIQHSYKTLNLIHFFTTGKDEVKCWTIRKGITAPGAAGQIHSDLEKGFLKAEVVSYKDFYDANGDENVLKKAGKMRTEGKDYVVEDGDMILFKAKGMRS